MSQSKPSHSDVPSPSPSKSAKRRARRVQKAEQDIAHLEQRLSALAAKPATEKRKTKAASANAELAVLRQGVKRSMIPYLRCLINPEIRNAVRLPDNTNYPTALVHSRHVLDVIGNYVGETAPEDLGRFTFVVSPTLLAEPFLSNVQVWSEVTTGTQVGVNDTVFALGAHVASLSPIINWSPDTSFQEQGALAKTRPGKLQVQAIPNIPSTNSWVFQADPNAATLAGDKDGFNVYTGGIAETVRPVAMSVWFECTTSALTNGGDVAAALLPSGAVLGNICPYNWTSATPGTGTYAGQGSLCQWENLATFPGAYCGKLRDGTYSYWVPQSVRDTMLLTPTQNAIADFPMIMVSGQCMTADGTNPGVIGRLQIETVWEYTTNSQLPALAKSPAVPMVLDEVKIALYNQPTSMANGEHIAWWKRLLASAAAGVGGLIVGGPAGAAAAAGTVFAAL